MIEIRRLPRLVALVVSSALLVTCSSSNASGGAAIDPSRSSPSLNANPCAGNRGYGSPNKPVVCVDDRTSTITVNPDPIVVHDRSAKDHKPVILQWYSVSGRDLVINMRAGCTTNMRCIHGGCTAMTIPHRKDETGERRCKYDIMTAKGILDPDTVIVKCCTVPEPAP